MAREYIPKYIHREAWKRITSVIKDYNHLKSEYNLLLKCNNVSIVKKSELERKICVFERAYESADKETREIIRQRYWKGRIYRDIMLPMSESTMKRYVQRFVLDVGKNLGEI